MRKPILFALLLLAAGAPARAEPIPQDFTSKGADRQAIDTLLNTYTTAVSTKNEALFETLLLNQDIPFTGDREFAKTGKDTNFASFRKGVFSGGPFTQTFQDVHVTQDGNIADVHLVFVNKWAKGQSWGFKIMQLVNVGGHWKIASEFYTGHALP